MKLLLRNSLRLLLGNQRVSALVDAIHLPSNAGKGIDCVFIAIYTVINLSSIPTEIAPQIESDSSYLYTHLEIHLATDGGSAVCVEKASGHLLK